MELEHSPHHQESSVAFILPEIPKSQQTPASSAEKLLPLHHRKHLTMAVMSGTPAAWTYRRRNCGRSSKQPNGPPMSLGDVHSSHLERNDVCWFTNIKNKPTQPGHSLFSALLPGSLTHSHADMDYITRKQFLPQYPHPSNIYCSLGLLTFTYFATFSFEAI